MDHQPVGRTLRALLPPVVISVAVSEAGLLLARRLLEIEWLRPDQDVAGSYLQTVGTIYAVLLAFVVFVVWTQFNDARNYCEREANELVDLYRTAKALPEKERRAVHDLLASYVDQVLDREWAAMARGNDKELEKDWILLDDLWDVLSAYEPATSGQSANYQELLARFNDLSDTRTNRLSSARLRIPRALHILLYSGAVVVIASMYMFAVEKLAVHALMTGALAGTIALVLYLVGDLDACFEGDWQVPRSPFLRVRRYIECCRGET